MISRDDYLQCDNPCGKGVQTRNVKCQEVEGKVMNESFCAGLEQPPTERECWDDRRSKCTPLWHEGEFGEVRWFGNNQDTVLPPPKCVMQFMVCFSSHFILWRMDLTKHKSPNHVIMDVKAIIYWMALRML